VLRHRNCLLSGDAELGFEAYIARRYFDDRNTPRDLALLSLGCGRGQIDRRLAGCLPIRQLVGLDIAEQNLAVARRAAAAMTGIEFHYASTDLNHVQLEPRAFDVVIAAGILHHLAGLEHVLDQVQRCLKPGGLLFLDEYVGPDRFQFPPRQRQLIEEGFASLPARLRVPYADVAAKGGAALSAALTKPMLQPRVLWAKARSGRLLDAMRYRLALLRVGAGRAPSSLARPRFPTAADVAAGDPSEAVRSSEILSLLRERFEMLEERGTGLGLLQFLLADIAHHFVDATDVEAQAELGRLIQLELTHLSAGLLQHDFVFVAAKTAER
jgi:SAM-dependent methyltransferase